MKSNNLTPPPLEITKYDQWVCWRYGKNRPNGKREKEPLNPRTGQRAKINDPSTWGTYEEAKTATQENGYEGIGFVFTKDDPFAGGDLDEGFNLESGELEPWAVEIVESLNSYTEMSPSGKGVKVWVIGTKPGKRCETHVASGKLEVYDSGRFFTFTGQQIRGNCVEDRQAELDTLYKRLFPQQEEELGESESIVVVNGGFEGEDEDLLERARRARNGPRFSALYDEGDLSRYDEDHNKGDMALCGMLAFWTGRNPQDIDRLFRKSALMREKWDKVRYADGSTYGEVTVKRAAANCRRIYKPKYPAPPTEVKRKLARNRALAASLPWTGRTGPQRRHIYDVFIDTGGWAGRPHTGGTEVTMSYRYIALQSGMSKEKSVRDGVKALEEEDGLIEVLKKGEGDTPTTYLIKDVQTVPLLEHLLPPPCVYTGTVRTLLRQVRNNSPSPRPGPYEVKRKTRDGNRLVSYVERIEPGPPKVTGSINKSGALLVEKVLLAGPDGIDLKGLSYVLQRSQADIRRILAKVLEAGLVIEKDGIYRVPGDIESRLRAHVSKTGAYFAADLQRAKYEAERDPDRAPTEEELARECRRMQAVFAQRAREDKEWEEDWQRRKIGKTAKDVLREELAEGRIMWWQAIVKRARPISQAQLRSAARELGVSWHKEWDGWYVCLRDEVAELLPTGLAA
jgi:hypothetical protein